jgi:hypothetical protein
MSFVTNILISKFYSKMSRFLNILAIKLVNRFCKSENRGL